MTVANLIIGKDDKGDLPDKEGKTILKVAL